jgi:O-antigen ligase
MDSMSSERVVGWSGAALLGGAFLLPAGDGPWFSFWREWTASVAVLLIVAHAFSRLRDQRRPLESAWLSLPSLALLLAVLPWWQWAAGIESYRGDAALFSAYLVGFALCVASAQSLAAADRARLADRIASALLFAAVCSVPLAWLQWTGSLRLDLDVKVVAGRPVAHMEQANLLCSLLLQGLMGAWRLHERGRLGRWLFAALGVILLLTVGLTQSRVSWLVLTVAIAAFAWRRRALELRTGPRWFVVAAVIVGAGALLVPWVDGQLGFTAMSLADRTSGGRRPDVWRLFLDAVAQHPWRGWGAGQNGAAQFALALAHPPLLWLFTSAHDAVLDLMVWFGVPAGLVASAGLIAAVASRVARSRDGPSFVTAIAVTALLLHGLVEFPLQYAYFLLPLGLMMGCSGDPESSRARAWRLPVGGRATLPILAIAPAAFLALLARDYMPLSDTRPVMAYDRTSHHSSLAATPELPDVLILDQLAAFHSLAAQRAAPGMAAPDVAALRKPMLRFPFAPSQEHYAHVVALNGDPADALDALRRGCTFMTRPQCDDSHRAWAYWRAQGEALPAWP